MWRAWCLVLTVAVALVAGAFTAGPAAAAAPVPTGCSVVEEGMTCTGASGQSVTVSPYRDLAKGDMVKVTARNFSAETVYGFAGQVTSVGGVGNFGGSTAELDLAAAATPAGYSFELVLGDIGGLALTQQSFIGVGDVVPGARATSPRLGPANGYDTVVVPTYFSGQVEHDDIDAQVDALYLTLDNDELTAPNGDVLYTYGFAPGEEVTTTLKDAQGREATVRDPTLADRTFAELPYAPDQTETAYTYFYVPADPGTYTLTATGQTSGITRTRTLTVIDPAVEADASATTVTDPRSGLKVTVSKTRELDPDGEKVLVTYRDNPTYGEQQEVLVPTHTLAPSLDQGTWAPKRALSLDRPMTATNGDIRTNREGSFVVEVNGSVPLGQYLASAATTALESPDATAVQSYLAVGNARTRSAGFVPLSFAGSSLPQPSADQQEIFARVTPGPLHPGDTVSISTWYFNDNIASTESELTFTTDIPGLAIPAKKVGNPAWGPYFKYLQHSFVLPVDTPPGRYSVTATDPSPGGKSLRFTVVVPAAPTVSVAPADASVLAGDDVTFTARAEGFPVPATTWQRRSSAAAAWTEIAGEEGGTLTLRAVPAAASGSQVRAVFTNESGQAETRAATLTVIAPPPTGSDPVGPATASAAASTHGPAGEAATTTTRLSLSAARSRYGAKRSATIVVRRADGKPVTGSVAVTVDGRRVAGATVAADGRATVALPRDLRVGSRSVIAMFSGGAGVTGSTSPAATLRIGKARARLAVRVEKAGRDGWKATVAVSIVGSPTKLRPTGRVELRVEGRRVAAGTLKPGQERPLVLAVPGAAAGGKLSVTYRGDANVAASTRTVSR